MKFSIKSRFRLIPGACPLLAGLLAVSMVITISSCDQNRSNDPASSAAEVSLTGELRNQQEIAGTLIKRFVEQPGGSHVAVEIDAENLQNLVTMSGQDKNLQAFREPVPAARLFASHIGLPADAEFAIVERSQQPEEASGLYIAVVQVTSGDRSTQMRMISEPDPDDQPTLWVLNDYRQ
ncbi:MAG: hypothetical protein QNK24_07290 [Desulfuromusa sp.]|nr:hypothetical protein [Desulfuromusa sp.]